MLEPFPTLDDRGSVLLEGGPEGRPLEWTPELIGQLDWLRLGELVRTLVAEAGCRLAGSRVSMDGSILFGMMEGVEQSQPSRVVVKTTAWGERRASADTVERFAREVATARDARGILVAVDGFSVAAIHAARTHRIETVDAQVLHSILERLPEERRRFFLVIATAGDWAAPSCPVCLRKLKKVAVDVERPMEMEQERLLPQDEIVAEPLFCRRLRVARHCEVQFLQQVRALEMHVEGTVHGDILCDGTLYLASTGVLEGTVAARSLRVEDGAELRAKTTVLVEPLEPLVRRERIWQWRCDNPTGRAECARVLLEPHA